MADPLFQIIIVAVCIPILLAILWRIRLKRLAVYHSPKLGKIEVLQKYNGEKMLAFNNYAQGLSTDRKNINLSYWYAVARQTLNFCQHRKSPQVLMLGLGANTTTKLIADYNPKIEQTIVEFDEFVIKACEDFFGLKSIPNCQVILANAFELIPKSGAFDKKFDCIICDIYTGKIPFLVKKSCEPDFITQLVKHLKKDGLIIFNWPAHTDEVRSEGEELKKYLTTIFKKTEIINVKDPRGYHNNLIIGSVKFNPSTS